MGKVIIQRESGFADRIRKYKIILNEKEIGTLGNGETKEFDAPTSNNEIFLKIDWCRSNKLRFESSRDSVNQFSGGSNMKGIKLLFSIVYLFIPHEWLWLRKDANNSN